MWRPGRDLFCMRNEKYVFPSSRIYNEHEMPRLVFTLCNFRFVTFKGKFSDSNTIQVFQKTGKISRRYWIQLPKMSARMCGRKFYYEFSGVKPEHLSNYLYKLNLTLQTNTNVRYELRQIRMGGIYVKETIIYVKCK